MNQSRYFLPHIFALSTNSPFWLGRNTGLEELSAARSSSASRAPASRTYFDSPREFESYVKLLVKTGCIDNAKKIWWDIRLHPFFDTLEFRICDMPMRVDETIALAALIQAVCAKLYKLSSRTSASASTAACSSTRTSGAPAATASTAS